MNTNLTEFQRVNGDEDDLLPLYNITKETKEAKPKASKKLLIIESDDEDE